MAEKEYAVNCIRKPDRYSPHEHITHIGNNSASPSWVMLRETAIRRIDLGKEAFYTVDKTTGRKMYIGVVRGDGNKAPYLRTHADGKWNDNLLAQDTCNASCTLVN
jgi:Protein of unknown function (DUF3892)